MAEELLDDMTNENPDDSQESEGGIKDLRRKASKADELEKALTGQQREIAFLKAGVDTSSKIGSMLMQTYQGDLEPDVIKAEALEVGAIKTSEEPKPETPATPEEQAVLEGQQQLAGSESTVPPVAPEDRPRDPLKDGYEKFDEQLREGATRGEASAEVTTRIIDAALHGDKRFLVSKEGQE